MPTGSPASRLLLFLNGQGAFTNPLINIDGANIVAGTITTTQIAATTILDANVSATANINGS